MKQKCKMRGYRNRILLSFLLGILCVMALYGQAAEAANTSFNELPADARMVISKAMSDDLPDAYVIRADGDGFQTENPAHGLKIGFGAEGVLIRDEKRACEWGMTLTGVGYGKAQPVPSATMAVAGNRAEYRRGDALTEWYLNTPFGLEQGFTLSEPPGEGNGERLRLEIALGGNLTASVRDEKTLVLSDASGKEAFRYAGLAVLDADGNELPAWLSVSGGRLMIDADDTDARYPVIIDPWIQDAKLTASDGGAYDEFGTSVSVSGDTVVVGAYRHNSSQGAAYVFEKSGTTWSDVIQTAKLTASDGATDDEFGTSVSVSGDTVVVGAYKHNLQQGAVYVFEKPGTGWSDMTQTAKLTASDGAGGEYFGWSVSIGGDMVVVGAAFANSDRGAAYVFEKSGTGWTQTAKLTASDGAGSDTFGYSVSVSGDTVVVGAYMHDIGANSDQGAVYVFEKPGAAWSDMTQTAKLTASDGAFDDRLGWSVSVSGDTAVVGAAFANSYRGAAYVFKKGTAWSDMTETAQLTASDGAASDLFGSSVSVSGDMVVVGEYGPYIDGNSNQGAAYVFEKPGTGWTGTLTETDKLTASDGAAYDHFGCSVSVSGDTVVVGAPSHDIEDNSNQGAAYVFYIPLNITTSATVSVTSDSAVLGGNVTNQGDSPVTERGVCWSTSPMPTTADNKQAMGSGIGKFSGTVTGLTSNTVYYVRAYATNSAGTAYGTQVTFKTDVVLPVVTTGAVSDVCASSATCGGSVTIEEGYTILAKGLCWDTAPTPQAATDPHTNNGTALSDFTGQMTGLQPETTYYVRAYASVKINGLTYTLYGKQITFTTPGEGLSGDADGDGKVSLADAVLILKLLAGGDVGDAQISTDADVNSDGQIGIPEAVYIMQVVSQQRGTDI